MARTGAKQDVDLAALREGRRLFVSRCIECHTLPPYWHYSASEWPKIVDSMAHRASLKNAQRDDIVAYLLAARQL
jgi:mono/diheme cytochrome c family protein